MQWSQDAYFERAVAYFELGEFDKALDDYLQSDLQNVSFNKKIRWTSIPPISAGIAVGIAEGAGLAAIEFVPESLSTLRGMGNGLWAFSADPVGASKSFVKAALECVEYLRVHSAFQVVQDIVPELRELVQNYELISDYEKGKLIGHVIGKYGTDILICKYSITAVKAYRDLKQANQLMTLEALASPKNSQKILEEASKRWALRDEILKKGSLKINLQKQNKHVFKYMKKGDTKSILTYNDPQKLVDEFAGTGRKINKVAPGMPDYRERIDFGEKIGIWRSPDGLIAKDTTIGMIIYAKDGVHIVPLRP